MNFNSWKRKVYPLVFISTMNLDILLTHKKLKAGYIDQHLLLRTR